MAKKTIAALKEYFKAGKRPTESQFTDLIDSYIHMDAFNPNAYLPLSGGKMTGVLNLGNTSVTWISRDMSGATTNSNFVGYFTKLTGSNGDIDSFGHYGAVTNTGVVSMNWGYIGGATYNGKNAMRWTSDQRVAIGASAAVVPTTGYALDVIGNTYVRGDVTIAGNFNTYQGSLVAQHQSVNKLRADGVNTILSAASNSVSSGIFVRPLGDTTTTGQTVFGNEVIKYSTKAKYFETVTGLSKYENVLGYNPLVASKTGNVKITFPSTTAVVMWSLKVRVLQYVASTVNTKTNQLPMEITITGYNTAAGTVNINCGASGKNFHTNFVGVRTGIDTSNNKIVWLDFTGNLQYPKVIIDELVIHGSGATTTLYDKDWSVDITSDETGYTNQTSILLADFKELVTESSIAFWNNAALRSFSTDYNNGVTPKSFTTNMHNLPLSSYVTLISTSTTNLPFGTPGGLISFGSGAQTTKILGARDNSDNLWFQSGVSTGAWRQLATRDWVIAQLGSASTAQRMTTELSEAQIEESIRPIKKEYKIGSGSYLELNDETSFITVTGNQSSDMVCNIKELYGEQEIRIINLSASSLLKLQLQGNQVATVEPMKCMKIYISVDLQMVNLGQSTLEILSEQKI